MKVIVDAMGGDLAPDSVVKGSVQALKDQPEIEVIMVGDQDQIDPLLEKQTYDEGRIYRHHADEMIHMDEDAVSGIRQKSDASINHCVKLLEEGKGGGLFSAGNTGATVASSTLNLGRLDGVDKPGIAVPIPHASGITMLIDAGANIYCKPEHLFQYGIMAAVFRALLEDFDQLNIGVLNIGEERGKGNELVQETIERFENAPLENCFPLQEGDSGIQADRGVDLTFIGNVEGQEIFSEAVDVVVTEGFLGNSLLKTLEGFGSSIQQIIKQVLGQEGVSPEVQKQCKQAVGKAFQQMDYAEHGGAPLLGLDGVCVIGHGKSSARAVRNAIKQTYELSHLQINQSIGRELQHLQGGTNDG